MAFTMGQWTKFHSHPFHVVPGGQTAASPPTLAYHYELADQAATTTPVMQCPTGIAWVRALIYQKGWGSGSGTVGPTYSIQVAFDSGFTSNLRELETRVMQRDGNNQMVLMGAPIPDLQSLTFCRILLTLSGTDAVTFDAMVDLVPGF